MFLTIEIICLPFFVAKEHHHEFRHQIPTSALLSGQNSFTFYLSIQLKSRPITVIFISRYLWRPENFAKPSNKKKKRIFYDHIPLLPPSPLLSVLVLVVITLSCVKIFKSLYYPHFIYTARSKSHSWTNTQRKQKKKNTQ